MGLSVASRFVLQPLKAAFRELRDDLQDTRWARGFGWFSFCVFWCGGLITAIAVVFSPSFTHDWSSSSIRGIAVSPCRPDGSFSMEPRPYKSWAISGVYQITLAFGNLTFANAKLIDVIWDIVIGRIGQILLSLVSCFVFAQYIAASMTVSPVSYATYSTVFFRLGPNTHSMFTLLREFIYYRALNSKVAMIWMTLSAAFIALFPTWVSAMSGYESMRKAHVKVGTSKFILSDFRYIDYIIHDGDRIGLTKDYIMSGNTSIIFPDSDASQIYESECDNWCNLTTKKFDPKTIGGPMPDGCFLLSNVSSYVAKYGFDGTSNATSVFEYNQIYNLSAPALNISAYYITSQCLFGSRDIDPYTNTTLRFANPSNAAFVVNGILYPYRNMSSNGVCDPVGTYKWGFSFLLLSSFLLTLLVWSIGTYIFWLKAYLALKVQDIHEIPGKYQAVIRLGAEMQQEFAKGEDITCLDERQIVNRIRRDLKGGAIENDGAIIRHPQYRFREVVKRWFSRDKWWFGGFVVLTVVWVTLRPIHTRFAVFTFIVCVFLSVGTLLAMFIGTKPGSRMLILLFCGVLSIPGYLWLYFGLLRHQQ